MGTASIPSLQVKGILAGAALTYDTLRLAVAAQGQSLAQLWAADDARLTRDQLEPTDRGFFVSGTGA